MTKRFLVLILTALVLLSALPALAVAPADLNALARYFPADTPVFVSARIDDDFIATINTLAESIAARFPDADMDESLQEALDDMVEELYPDGDFQATIRPWLGDTVSVGLLSLDKAIDNDSTNDEDMPALIAVSIRDQAAALDFMINALNQDGTRFFQTTGDGYTLLVIDESAMPASLNDADLVIVRDDVLLFSANTDSTVIVASGLQSPSLFEQPAFTGALGWLPADSYNITIYADVVNDILAASASMDADTASAMEMLEQIGFSMDSVGPVVVGFTILDGSVLTIDEAQAYDPAAGPMMIAIPGPVDMTFAARIPAGVPLALHGTGLKTQLEATAQSYSALFEAMAAQPGMDADEIEAARAQVEKQLMQVNNLFTSFTDLNFNEDVLSWMDGDAIAFIGFSPDIDASSPMGLMAAFPLEFGVGIEATDPAKAQAAVEGFTKALNQLAAMANVSMGSSGSASQPADEITVTTDTLNGVSVTVVTLIAKDLPWPVELLMGANDSVFALGTRSAVSAMFAADGGLTSNPEFQAAQAYMLPNPTAVAWLNPAGLLPLADLAEAMTDPNSSGSDAASARSLLTFIRSATATSAYDTDNNVMRARLTLTLAAE